MLRRNGRILISTSAALCVVGLVGAPTAMLLQSEVPDGPDIEWAYPWSHDSTAPEEGERIARVENAAMELERSMAVQLLASPATVTELHDAYAGFRASTNPFEGSPSSPEQELALAMHGVRNSALGTPVIASILFVVMGLSGLLSFLRLRRLRGVTFLTCSLLALGVAAGISGLALFELNPVWAVAPTLLSVLGFFGVLVGTNLLPDSNHPLVVAAEERLRGLAARKRRVHMATRVFGGLFLSGAAVIGTVVSHTVTAPGAFYTAYVGAFAVGLIATALPLIAAARLSTAESLHG